MNNNFYKIPQSRETFAEHCDTLEHFAELGNLTLCNFLT